MFSVYKRSAFILVDFYALLLCTNKEITDIISGLNFNKATGPDSTLIKNMKLAKDCITNNLSVLFNLSFSSGAGFDLSFWITVMKSYPFATLYLMKKDENS